MKSDLSPKRLVISEMIKQKWYKQIGENMRTLKVITSILVIWSTMFSQLFGESDLCYDYGITEVPPSKKDMRPMMKVSVIPTSGGAQATLISYSAAMYDVTKYTESVIGGVTNITATFEGHVPGWVAFQHGGLLKWKDACGFPGNYTIVRMWLFECDTTNVVAYGQAKMYGKKK